MKPKNIGTFTTLLILSVLRPSQIFNSFNFSFAPLIVTSIFILILISLVKHHENRMLIIRNKKIISLIVLFNILSIVSLTFNISTYSDNINIYKYGLSPIICHAFFFAVPFYYLLPIKPLKFSLSDYKNSQYLLFLIPTVIFLIAFYQKIDFKSALSITSYFLPGEYFENVNDLDKKIETNSWYKNVRSVFSSSTDLGAICSTILSTIIVIFIISGNSFNKRILSGTGILIMTTGILIMITGILSGSRSFLLSCIILLIALLIQRNRFSLKTIINCTILSVVAFHLLLFFSPDRTTSKLANALPYVDKIKNNKSIKIGEFIPNITPYNVDPVRAKIWEEALFEYIVPNPIIGTSNGVFRTTNSFDNPEFNAHNTFIQILIDSGLLGFLTTCLIACYFFKSIEEKRRKTIYLLFLFISPQFLFEYFIDHSLPWILITTYCFYIVSKGSALPMNVSDPLAKGN